jgi:serine/threonine protein kinase/Tfp pilus assembly protein PilF
VPDDRWQRVKELMGAALERPAEAREAFLREACGRDHALRQEVESLLSAGREAGVLISEPARLDEGEPPPALSPGDHREDVVSSRRLPVGKRLGPYEIVSFIGAGGMGEVYRARDTHLGREVAIKVLPPRVAADPDLQKRFEREARAVAALNHPHIVTIFSTEEADGVRFMTMELIEGRRLDQLIPRGGVSLAQFFDIAIPLADALSAAHRKHLTHRDLKPGNVMVSDDGRVKVLDFGLARSTQPEPGGVGADETRLRLTKEGTILGTMPYMSPEQIEGKPLDPRTDIFSLGIMLYEMATGARPFGGGSSPALMSSILKDRPRPVAERRPDVPGDVSRLIDRCLEKDPRDRIQTATEILAELKAQRRAWESGAGSGAKPASDVTAPPAERVASIAVLPFTDMSAAKDQDWFCDGIAEEILNALTPLKGLRVAARTSAFSFKGKSDDLRTIGEKLNVTTVLTGSMRRAGDRVRITVQLSDVANGFQLWSERYDRELKDIFDVQDEIAKAIVERLRVTLAGSKGGRLVEQGTTNVEAYQLYLKGYALLSRRGASIPAALDLFRKAVKIDPDYSLAWAGIADAVTGLAITGSVRGSESKPQAMAAATRSIELDPVSAAGHTALACATLLHENNRAMAKQEFERALELRPGYALGRSWYATFYLQWARGELEQGIAEARRALDGDPLSAYVMMLLACCLCTAGRLNEAIETAGRAVQQDLESFITRWILGVSLGTAGRFEEAVSTLEAAVGISGRHSRALTSLAVVFGQWEKPSEASALHRELTDRASGAYVPLTYLALTAEASGQHEEAMAFARRAWDEREPPFILHARHFPEFRTLRSDPRFAAILREMDEP